MAQELAIIKQENIQTIVQSAPQSYLDNKVSQDNCNRAGQAILDAIMQQGMTDELDQQAATFIEKSRKTVKKMNERRSPVTKLFDDIRKEYTVLENSIDPTKAGTIAYQLQEQRNKFAAKKRAEEEERRRKEFERQQAEQARSKMKQDIEDDFKQQFMALTNKACNDITAIDNNVSLDNYTTSLNMFKEWNTALPADFLYNLHTTIRIPAGVPVDELRKIELETKERLAEQYAFEVESMLEYVLDRMPSKKANLERMAKASAEEAARIKAEMEERQRKEAEEQEKERKRKEEEERQQAELQRQQAEMSSLFAGQAAMQGYQPKAKVSKKIELLNPEGVLAVISMWWSKEGCTLTTDELAKMFKKQITFCEKLANKEEIFIADESVCYIDEVKAK